MSIVKVRKLYIQTAVYRNVFEIEDFHNFIRSATQ